MDFESEAPVPVATGAVELEQGVVGSVVELVVQVVQVVKFVLPQELGESSW